MLHVPIACTITEKMKSTKVQTLGAIHGRVRQSEHALIKINAYNARVTEVYGI